MVRYSLEELGQTTAFDVDLTEGEAAVGGLLLLTAPDGADLRAFQMKEVRGNTLVVERVPATMAVRTRR
jgi:hypothetical protein